MQGFTSEAADSLEVSVSAAKSRRSFAGMRIAPRDHHELTVASVDQTRKEEVRMAGQAIRRGSMTIR